MSERVALKCADCDNCFAIKTPDSQAQVIDLIKTLKYCKDCGGNMLLVAYLCR